MPRRLWCSLCGVLITPTDHPWDESLDWMADVRIVRTADNRQKPWKDCYITGVGYLDTHFTVQAPLDPKPYTGRIKSEQPNVMHEIFGDSKRYWAFPFHDNCWELLRDRIGRDVEPNELAPHLFLYFYNMPIHDHERLMPGHDYGGADSFRFRVSRAEYMYYSQIDASDMPHLYRIPDTPIQMDKHAIWETVESFAAPFKLPEALFLNGTSTETNVIVSLPNEVITIILTYLPNSDLCNLRLASRSIAQITAPSKLPPAFWRSRFDPEFEMGFVFAGPSRQNLAAPNTNWRDLYLHAQATLFERELFGGFENRRRIWLVVQHAAKALKLRLNNQNFVQKEPYTTNSSQLMETEQQGSWVSADAAVPLYPLHSLAKADLIANCRMMEMQKFAWGLQGTGHALIKASFVEHGDRRYLCGLSFERKAGEEITTETAGFVNSSNFQEVALDLDAVLERIEVALCCTGILGLRFHLRRQGDATSCDVGDFSTSSQVGGISELRVGEGQRITSLMLGLDAFKIISISLVEEANFESGVTSASHHVTRSTAMAVQAEVWTSAKPKKPFSWLFQNTLLTQLHDVCEQLNFGGDDGSRLKSLVKVTAQMRRYPAVFVGLKFTYKDGTECGSNDHGDLLHRRESDDPVMEQVFLIDGPGGEVIDQITVAYSMEFGNIRKITCRTNYNRSIDFGTHGGYNIQDTLSVKKIEAEPDSVLTSFFVKLKMAGVVPPLDGSFDPNDHCPRGFFRNFAAVSVARESSEPVIVLKNTIVDHMVPINRKTLVSAERVLQFEGNYFFAAADFTNVRRIRMSVGEKPNTIDQRVFTGLQLEYHDSKSPVIIGQWIEEMNHFDVAANDRIVGLRIGNRFQANPFLGPIDSLYFWTASGHEAEYVSHDEHPSVWCRLFFEDAYEHITGIVWGSNYKWDHAWPLIEPKPGSPRLILGWCPMDSTPCPSSSDTILNKITFDGDETHDTGNQLVSIEVGFWKYGRTPDIIKFIFKDSPTQVIGEMRTSVSRPRKVHLDDGEYLTGLELGLHCSENSSGAEATSRYSCSRLIYLNFTTSKNRTLVFRDDYDDAKRRDKLLGEHEHLVLIQHIPFTPEAAEMAANKVASEKTEIITKSISECLAAGCTTKGPEIVVVDLPPGAKRCIGMWAPANTLLSFPNFGPLFEGDIVDEK